MRKIAVANRQAAVMATKPTIRCYRAGGVPPESFASYVACGV